MGNIVFKNRCASCRQKMCTNLNDFKNQIVTSDEILSPDKALEVSDGDIN
jgi:hypothetical protein